MDVPANEGAAAPVVVTFATEIPFPEDGVSASMKKARKSPAENGIPASIAVRKRAGGREGRGGRVLLDLAGDTRQNKKACIPSERNSRDFAR